MADERKPPTYTARALKRVGRRFVRWLEVGTGRQGEDGSFTAYLDRTPIGGWTGYVHFAPIGTAPPALPPERPGKPQQPADGDEEFDG
jgi:hypothetical protein